MVVVVRIISNFYWGVPHDFYVLGRVVAITHHMVKPAYLRNKILTVPYYKC